ncbi:MAG: hypothetical protein AAGC78_14535 [Cellvibrio sp.]|uniref:hypothetical protein n=1 Tax=Cellvibrio sp. TaxID=1965322 RepID=UPI0031B201C8
MSLPTRYMPRYFQGCFLFIAFVSVIIGLLLSDTSMQNYWSAGALEGAGAWMAISAGLIMLCKFSVPRAEKLALIIGFMLVLFAGNGVLASFSCLLFALSMFSLGRIISRCITDEPWHIGVVLILGLVGYVVIFGIMIHFPINYRAGYIFILLVPLCIEFIRLSKQQKIGHAAREFIQGINSALSPIAYWKLAMLLTIIGFFSSYSFVLSVTSDDNSYHLAMWSQLHTHHQYLFDVTTQIWYAAPFTLDMIHGIVSVIANSDSRGALNIFLLIALFASTAMTASQLFDSINVRLLCLAFLASTPMLFNLLSGLQTELILSVLTMAAICIGINRQMPFIQRFLGVLLVSFLLIAIKLPAAVLAGSLCLCLLVSEWNNFRQICTFSKFTFITVSVVLALGLGAALNPYLSSYFVTGNPVFPLYNAIFQSPYYNPVNFKDSTFTHGASLQAWWAMFFDSSKYFESKNFSAGFHYLLLPLAGILCLSRLLRFQTLLYLALPVVLFGSVMFYMMQYIRYLFPIMPVACILAAGVFYMPGGKSIGYFNNTLAAITVVALVSLNFYFLPGISWIYDHNSLKNFTQHQKQKIAVNYNPEHVINLYLNEIYPGENVLFESGRCNGALLYGKPFYPDWVSPSTLAAFDRIKSEEDLVAYLKANNIRFVYWNLRGNTNNPPFRDHLKIVIDKYGKMEQTAGEIGLYKLSL